MSLTDAMLLEGYRDPKEVYIALRTDGLKGSGTIDDPYDGGVAQGPQLSGTPSYNLQEVIAFTPGNHGYATNDNIIISGVTGLGMAEFNTTHQITVLNNHEFKFTLAGVPSAPPGPRDNVKSVRSTGGVEIQGLRLFWPVALVDTGATNHGYLNFDVVTISGATAAALNGTTVIVGVEATKFRLRLLAYPSGSAGSSCNCVKVIHRFDEVLRTNTDGSTIIPSNSIVHLGPGTFQTRGHCSAYSSDPGNLARLFVGWSLKDRQRIVGSGIEVTKLQIVHAADAVTLMRAVGSFEDISYSEVRDLTIDCNMGGQPVPAKTVFAPFACGAVQLYGSYNRLHRIRAINFGTQALPECFVLFLKDRSTNLNSGVHNVISDCIVESPSENNTHESTLIGSNGNEFGNARSPVVRHNYANCWFVTRNASSANVAIASITQDTGNPTRFTLVTKQPHHRVKDNNVLINGTASPGVLIGSFLVVQWISETSLVFEMPGNTASYPTITVSNAFIGVDYHGPLPGNGTGAVVEGNAIFDCHQAIYSDTGSSRDVVVRDNYFSGSTRGVYFNFNTVNGGGVHGTRSAKRLTQGASPNEKIATFEIPDDMPGAPSPPLQLSVGDAVTILGARINGGFEPPDGTYNGTYTVREVITVGGTKRKFTYEMKEDPGQQADFPPPVPINLFPRNQVCRFVYENNLCDFNPFTSDSPPSLAPRGATSIAYAPVPGNDKHPGPPFMFPSSVIRGNCFRYVDDAVSLSNAAIRVLSFENTHIDQNIISFTGPHVIHYIASENINAFQNLSPDGTDLPYFNVEIGSGGSETYIRQDGIEDKVADACLMGFL